MPRLTQQLPSYSKHKASGQAIVKFGGRVHYLGPHGSRKSKRKYQRLVGEWLTADRNPDPVGADGGELTIIELLVRYMPFAKRHYRKHGELTNEIENIKYALRPLKALYGRTHIKDFGPLALKALQTHLIEQGLARTTINARIAIIRRIFRWGVSEQLCPPSVIHGLGAVMGLQAGRTAARETSPVVPVADSVVEQTLEHLPQVVADMVRLQRLFGCRPAEICMLRPVDVDRTSDQWVYRPQSHKSEHHGRQRAIFIGPRGQAILRPYLLRDEQACCFQPVDSERKRMAILRENRKTRVQPSQVDRSKRRPKRKPGDRYVVDAYRRAIARACDLAFPVPDDLPVEQRDAWRKAHRWHPNQLRHAAASEIRKRFGLEAAQVVLGHATANISQIYAQRDERLGVEVARQIG